MNTEQIEQLCRSDQVLSPKFGGVFSRDNLPDLAEDAKFYVCNTDPSSEPGGHWVVLHAAAESGKYFDSLGGAITTMNLLSSSVGGTDTCPFKHRNYFLAFVVNIVYFTCV